jgi:hypothetical protein
LAAQLRDLTFQTNQAEASGDARSERCAGTSLAPDGIAEDLANFFFCTATVPLSTTLQLFLDIIIELADYELSHLMDDITIARRFEPTARIEGVEIIGLSSRKAVPVAHQ